MNNISFVLGEGSCSIDWQSAIIQYCNDWRNVSTYSHNFYMILILLAGIFSIISYLYPIHIKQDYGKHFKLNWLIDIEVFDLLRKIAIGALIVRITQVYFISKIYLGGL